MKNFINENSIPEEKESYSQNTSYVLNISKKDKEELQRIQKRYDFLIDKRKGDLSSFIKVILLNTYLYLTNMERDILEDIQKISRKAYYRDLSEEFKNMISTPSKEQDFVKELLRTRMLRAQEYDEEEGDTEPFQFRLAQDDDLLRYIFYGSTMPLTDYLTSLLDYFMSATITTKYTILYYQILLACKRCVQDNRFVMINGKKYAPIQIKKRANIASFSSIWAFDRQNKRMRRIPVRIIDDFKETNEYFTLTSDEQRFLTAMQNCDKVTISFDIVNAENDYFDRFTNQRFIRHSLYDVKYNEETKHVELTINSASRAIMRITFLKENAGEDIANLEYSDNLKNFLQVMEETGIKFRTPLTNREQL